jgi:hypothetical protein
VTTVAADPPRSQICNLLRVVAQINANKSKQMSLNVSKMLAFTSVYFFEPRLFKELRPIQIKKSPLHSRVARLIDSGGSAQFFAEFLLRRRHAEIASVSSNRCTRTSALD